MSDGKISKKIDYLDEERKKLWERILSLEKQISESPSDIEKEVRQTSKKAAEYRNKIEERLNQANEIYDHISNVKIEIEQKLIEISSNHTKATDINSNLLAQGNELSNVLSQINEVLENHPEIASEIEELDDLISKVEENSSKVNTTYKGILTKKTEIDELHREILGYKDKDENGETIIVEGLKTKLSNVYSNLTESAKSLRADLDELDKKSKNQFEDFINLNKNEWDKIKSDSKVEYDAINRQIESLLPNALTAGLSSAFVAKKSEEEDLYDEYKSSFNRGILLLSLVALMPITISIIFLSTGSTLLEVIERSPKIIFSFMPLYIPLIWITISANKKVNLSKRLIEEYSHKQVLSMTIEGLSKQIENIEDNNLSEDLRIKLLNNFLEVTNENPGKLISNYQKSDNPILNILDRDKKEKNNKLIQAPPNIPLEDVIDVKVSPKK